MVGWLSTESGGILEMQYVDDGLVHAVRDCILCSAVFPSKTSPVCKQQHSVSTSMHDASQIDAWSLCNNTQEELHAAFTASDININYSLCHKRSYKKHSILIVVVFVYNGAVSVAFFSAVRKRWGWICSSWCLVLLLFRAWSVILSLLLLFLCLLLLVFLLLLLFSSWGFGALIIQSLKCWELASYNETWCNLTHLSRFDRWSILNEGINDLIYNLQNNEKFIFNFDRWSMLNGGISDLIYNMQHNEISIINQQICNSYREKNIVLENKDKSCKLRIAIHQQCTFILSPGQHKISLSLLERYMYQFRQIHVAT